jgi:Helix-turn-helix domain
MDRRGSKSGERRATSVGESSKLGDETTMIAARGGFAAWLREGRNARGLSVEDVARVTRIQQRTLERLEEGRFEELPADVFVRGFIRNYARCVGIDPQEALARYGDCGVAPSPVASLEAQALLDSMASLAPNTARAQTVPPRAATASSLDAPRVLRARASSTHAVVAPPPELAEASGTREPIVAAPVVVAAPAVVAAPVVVAEPVAPPPVVADAVVIETRAAEPTSHGRRRAARVNGEAVVATEGAGESKSARRRRRRKAAKSAERAPAVAETMPVAIEPEPAPVAIDPEPAPVVAAPVAPAAPVSPVSIDAELAPVVAETAARSDTSESYAQIEIVEAPPVAAAPPSAIASISVGPAVAARVMARPVRTSRAMTVSSPSLVIDDDDPDTAERTREAREEASEPTRRSFLPPILLDDDRSGRQGGLTLAVIILLIVATLTLSYLMRRPSSSGEGVTARDLPAQLVG